MNLKRKAISGLLLGVFSISFLLFTFKVSQHFFEFKTPDLMAVVICFVLAFWLGSRWRGKIREEPLGLLTIVLAFSLFPLVGFLIQRSDYAWLSINTISASVGFLMSSLWANPRWSTLITIGALCLWIMPYDFQIDQRLYADKLVKSIETRKGKMHLVQWKNHQWWHYNKRLTNSSLDSHLYYEPLIHPVLHLVGPLPTILLIGGDNGKTVKELNKYPGAALTAIPFDQEIFQQFNSAFDGNMVETGPFQFLENSAVLFDLIIIDLPDPTTLELKQYYQSSFYLYCKQQLKKSGYIVTQASSPYLENELHQSVMNELVQSGFITTRYHNQIPSTGQWSWIIGSLELTSEQVVSTLKKTTPRVATKWWNQEAMQMMLSFGNEKFFQDSRFQVARTSSNRKY